MLSTQPTAAAPRAVGGMGSYPKGYDGDAESPLGCAGFQTQKTPTCTERDLERVQADGGFSI